MGCAGIRRNRRLWSKGKNQIKWFGSTEKLKKRLLKHTLHDRVIFSSISLIVLVGANLVQHILRDVVQSNGNHVRRCVRKLNTAGNMTAVIVVDEVQLVR